jgi:hypothetical protein
VLEVKRCLKLFWKVLCATPVWPVRGTGLTGVTCEVQCPTDLTGHHHRFDRWSAVSSSIWGERVLIGRLAYSPPTLGDIKVLSNPQFMHLSQTWALQKLTDGPQTFTEKTLNFLQIYQHFEILRKSALHLSQSTQDPCNLTKKLPYSFRKLIQNLKFCKNNPSLPTDHWATGHGATTSHQSF